MNYEPKGTRFMAKPLIAGKRAWRQMLLVTTDEPRTEMHGWLFFRHPEGQWVSLRKATDDDLASISAAIVAAHHAEPHAQA